jgi:hypothetical protein
VLEGSLEPGWNTSMMVLAWADPGKRVGSIWEASSLVVAAAAAVGVFGVLLLGGMVTVSAPGVLALSVAAQIGVCALMLAPVWRSVSWQLLAGCLVPGFALAGLSAVGGGLAAAFWLVGLPAWILLCRRWSGYRALKKVLEVLGFLGLYAVAALLLSLTVFVPNPVVLLLPLVPAARLYSGALPALRNLPALIELILSVGLVVLAFVAPQDAWTPAWSTAGGIVTGVLMLAWFTGRRPE